MANYTGNPSSNPFDHAFEMLGQAPEVTTEKVNAEALEKLTQALTSRAGERGRMILLRSPRAGFGKTHLLMRLHQRVAHTHEFIPLEPSKGRYLDAQSVLDAVLRRFSRVLPAGGGLTVLDLLARRILASGLEPLVRSGEVPSQDRDSALQALQQRPVETFDFHNDEAVTAQWAMANFPLLGPRLTAELAERTHSGYRPVAWWVELLFRYSSVSTEQSCRNSSLFETVFGGESVETDMHEKLVALLNLTGLVTSPVLILDEVEGFSSNPEAALQVATFLNALHQSCNKLALIISINGDVWETAFLPRLPCGLKDRLSDIIVDLKPMDKQTAASLLKDRAGSRADAIMDTMDFDSGVVYARGLIREASNTWSDIASADAADQWSAGADGGGLQDPISLVIQDETQNKAQVTQQDDIPSSPAEERPMLHAPEAVIPATEPPSFAGPNFGVEVSMIEDSVFERPVSDGLGAQVESPQLPADLPQPFVQQGVQQQNDVTEAPYFGPPSDQSVFEEAALSPFTAAVAHEESSVAGFVPATEHGSAGVAPQNVVDSPFSIDASVTPAQSPFQPVQPQVSPKAQTDSPFRTDQAATPAHEVTDNDHDKVEDLLKQFRDRYGRD